MLLPLPAFASQILGNWEASQASQGSEAHSSCGNLGRSRKNHMEELRELMDTRRAVRTAVGDLPTQELHLVFVLTRWIVNGPGCTAVSVSAEQVRGFLRHRLQGAVVGQRLPRTIWGNPILEEHVRELLFERLPIEELPEQELSLVGLLTSTILNHGPANAVPGNSPEETLYTLRSGLELALRGVRIPTLRQAREIERGWQAAGQRRQPHGSRSRSRPPWRSQR